MPANFEPIRDDDRRGNAPFPGWFEWWRKEIHEREMDEIRKAHMALTTEVVGVKDIVIANAQATTRIELSLETRKEVDKNVADLYARLRDDWRVKALIVVTLLAPALLVAVDHFIFR